MGVPGGWRGTTSLSPVVPLLLVYIILWCGVMEGVDGRDILAQGGSDCAVCGAGAGSICESMSVSERASASARLVSACQGLKPETCCVLRHSSDWDRVSACACSGNDVGASSVSLSSVERICGCSSSARAGGLPPLPGFIG